MELEEYLIQLIRRLGPVYFRKMFGWQCATVGKNFFAGYKLLDDSVMVLMLILSPDAYEKAIKLGGFEKFRFGKTWVEIELNNDKEINNVKTFIEDAFLYTKLRASKKKE